MCIHKTGVPGLEMNILIMWLLQSKKITTNEINSFLLKSRVSIPIRQVQEVNYLTLCYK